MAFSSKMNNSVRSTHTHDTHTHLQVLHQGGGFRKQVRSLQENPNRTDVRSPFARLPPPPPFPPPSTLHLSFLSLSKTHRMHTHLLQIGQHRQFARISDGGSKRCHLGLQNNCNRKQTHRQWVRGFRIGSKQKTEKGVPALE